LFTNGDAQFEVTNVGAALDSFNSLFDDDEEEESSSSPSATSTTSRSHTVFVPICDKSHWYLFVLHGANDDMSSGSAVRCFYYDSLLSSNRDINDEAVAQLHTLWDSCPVSDDVDLKLHQYVRAPGVHQRGGTDCGLYMFLCAWFFTTQRLQLSSTEQLISAVTAFRREDIDSRFVGSVRRNWLKQVSNV
jgi:Ulp1 family protease